MAVSLKTDLRFPESGQHGHGSRIIQLEKRTSEIAGDFIPCIAFGVGKYGYTDSEVCVVPTFVWNNQSQRGSVFSFSKGKYYYNYEKVDNKVPQGAILRTKWIAKDF